MSTQGTMYGPLGPLGGGRRDDEFISEVLPLIGWDIPKDFDEQERALLFEMCMQRQLSHEEALETIQLLRLKAGECYNITTQHNPVQDPTPHAVQSNLTPRRYNYYDC